MISYPEDSSPHPLRSPPSAGSAARTIWTIADLLTWTEKDFALRGLSNPRLDAELLLAHVMKLSRLELYMGYRKVVEPEERRRFKELVERRRRFEPIAYLLGYKEFYSLRFEVNAGVLVPRPETEILVDRILAELRQRGEGEPYRILDLGIGSGNIAIALAVHLPKARVLGVDISAEALEVARRNAAVHGVQDRCAFLAGDLFAALSGPGGSRGGGELDGGAAAPMGGAAGGSDADAGPGFDGFDVIASNPPYIAPAEYAALMPDVRDHEPELALKDCKGADGLGFYREIADQGRRHLRRNGLLALEVGHQQSGEVQKLLAARGWSEIHTAADFAGIERVVLARPPAAF